MKNHKYALVLFFFLLLNYFSQGQNNLHLASGEKNLMALYHQWSNVNSDEMIFPDGKSSTRIATSSFYPLKATNYNWNTTSSAWDIYDTTFYTYYGGDLIATIIRKNSSNIFLTRVQNSYDADDNKIESINQTWSSGWQNVSRDTFAFDNYGNIILHEYQVWISNLWQVTSGNLYQYTYNGTGKILVQISQSWNGTAWDTTSRFTNSYNGLDQITQTIRESWSTVSSSWSNTSKTDYSYDVSNINIQTLDYSWNTAWVNNAQIINPVWFLWTGDIATSKPTSYTYQIWSGSVWQNSQRLLNATYDSNGGSVETYQTFSSSWINDTRNSIFFDAQLNKTGKRDESWNTFTAAWDTTYEYRYIFTYDVNNSITQSIYQQYNNSVHAYINNFKTIFSDFIFVGIENISSPKNISIILNPNPMSEFSDVFVTSANSHSFMYRIYDIKGNIVFKELTNKKNLRIARNNFTSGVYLLRVSDSSGEISSLKFIVQ
ncbi:MAG: T9SS type A sorting domain-containing protein [Bacteroidia bacterium]|nr:T9SS type A sorting domain-containing protein [Bacteroidia bacterium]